MTNNLTKQYRKGTLPGGFYYFRNSIGQTYAVEYSNLGIKGCKDVEVLSEVPSFKVYKKLKKQLDIATKTLKDIRDWDEYDCMGLAKKALKEMEGVK